MRNSSLAAVAAVAAHLAACSPFASDHQSLGAEELASDSHFQSYYLPKTILTATVTTAGEGRDLTLGWESVVDRDYLFKVQYRQSIMHDDDLHIETTKKGFLASVQANSTDQTAAIVEAAVNIMMTSIGGKPFGGNRTLPTDGLGTTHLMTSQFDPFDPHDFGEKNRRLGNYGYCLAVYDRINRVLPGSCMARTDESAIRHDPSFERIVSWPRSGQGFFYRRPIEHRVVVYQKKGHRWTPIWDGWHQFEQQAEILEIRVDRGSFIALQATLDFDEGVLKKYTMNKPSEMLGFMKIPTVIVNAVVQIPGLQIAAQEDALNLRERALNSQEKALALQERQLSLRSAGVGPDGREVYEVPSGATRTASVDASVRNLTEEKSSFLARCRDQLGDSGEALSPAECEDAWRRSRNY